MITFGANTHIAFQSGTLFWYTTDVDTSLTLPAHSAAGINPHLCCWLVNRNNAPGQAQEPSWGNQSFSLVSEYLGSSTSVSSRLFVLDSAGWLAGETDGSGWGLTNADDSVVALYWYFDAGVAGVPTYATLDTNDGFPNPAEAYTRTLSGTPSAEAMVMSVVGGLPPANDTVTFSGANGVGSKRSGAGDFGGSWAYEEAVTGLRTHTHTEPTVAFMRFVTHMIEIVEPAGGGGGIDETLTGNVVHDHLVSGTITFESANLDETLTGNVTHDHNVNGVIAFEASSNIDVTIFADVFHDHIVNGAITFEAASSNIDVTQTGNVTHEHLVAGIVAFEAATLDVTLLGNVITNHASTGTITFEAGQTGGAGVGDIGLRVYSVPLDCGRRTGASVAAMNDTLPDGIVFDAAAPEFWASQCPEHWWLSWDSGDVVVRLLAAGPLSGDVGDAVRMQLQYTWIRAGVQHTDLASVPSIAQTTDISASTFKTPLEIDFIIPEAEIDPTAQQFYWRLTRVADDASDTYASNWYVHDLSFRWNGLGLSPE